MFENQETTESAVLVAVDTGEYDVDASLQELEELAATAGIATLAQVVQKRSELDKATAVGAGKLEEITPLLDGDSPISAGLVIFDHELSGTQLRNIEEICKVPVLDRTMLILEIFAARAQSSEGKLQVELARQRYMLPRLTGMGTALSRLGGGGGGAGAGARRGKGETKLELDRRHIRRRIALLESQMRELSQRRGLHRARRKKDGVLSAAIVGYTNAGKSTLLNALTDAGVLAEDKLFATLDPTSRALLLPDGRSVMLVDTVGLIRRLPHHLVEAFKSTLEEAVHADLLLHVCDMSAEDAQEQAEVVSDVLAELGAHSTPVLTVLNKCDKVDHVPLTMGTHTAVISAKTGFGLENLLSKIAAMLEPSQRRMSLLIPYSDSGLLDEIRREGKVFSQEFQEAGTVIDALVDRKLVARVHGFIVQSP